MGKLQSTISYQINAWKLPPSWFVTWGAGKRQNYQGDPLSSCISWGRGSGDPIFPCLSSPHRPYLQLPTLVRTFWCSTRLRSPIQTKMAAVREKNSLLLAANPIKSLELHYKMIQLLIITIIIIFITITIVTGYYYYHHLCYGYLCSLVFEICWTSRYVTTAIFSLEKELTF